MLYIKRVLKWKNSYHFERRKEHWLIMYFYFREEIFYCLMFFSEMIRHFNCNIQRLKVNSKMKQFLKNTACLFSLSHINWYSSQLNWNSPLFPNQPHPLFNSVKNGLTPPSVSIFVWKRLCIINENNFIMWALFSRGDIQLNAIRDEKSNFLLSLYGGFLTKSFKPQTPSQ